MARITHVKAARQRYATVPVIDPETGEQKKTPVMVTRKVRQEDGEYAEVITQKTTKHGRPVFMKITESDKNQPLPNHSCEKCGKEIKVGDPYKHVTPKSGPYGGRTRRRCAACPAWEAWDLSNALWARIEQVISPAQEAVEDAKSDHDAEAVRSALEEAAQGVRELAEEKSESAQNMEDGFGHETEQSMELRDQGEQLEQWADEIEAADIPDFPEDPEGEEDCGECGGSGEVDEPETEEADGDTVECSKCAGTGRVEATEVTEDQVSDWETEVDSGADILGNNPV